MSHILPNDFFNRETVNVAQDLLGKNLCRRYSDGRLVKWLITETEAYLGAADAACHSFENRRTDRTRVMYGEPGTIYMYLIYGMYWMLNVVTEQVEVPTAVLIRGAGDYDGPGKLTRALHLNKSFNNRPLGKDTGLWIEDGVKVSAEQISATPRIGISYAAEPWRSALLRFIVKNNEL